MTRGKRTYTADIEVRLLREGIIESIHHVQAALCDERGRVLASAGDPETSTFVRSALKPFQAIALTSSGTMERYDLTDKDLAIVCSSHRGMIGQARQAFNILWRSEIEPTALQCPCPPGKQSSLQHNCSGKHAGMLAVCKQRNWSLAGYLERDHPVQKMILERVADLLHMPAAEFIGVHDDCGVPTYLFQLQQIAALYAQLASGNNLDMERIIRAMTHYPTLIAGKGEFDTELMCLAEGELLSKAGAEGIQCVAKVGEGLGLAIKVQDGSKRAKYAVAIHLLKQLGWIMPTMAEKLADSFMSIGDYKRLDVVGELTMA